MKMKKVLSCLAVTAMALALAQTPVHAEEANVATGTQKLVIVGDDWGPGVSKTIINFDKAIDSASLDKDDFEVTETKETVDWGSRTFERFNGTVDREVLKVYASDASGNEVEAESSKYVTIEMYISPNDGSPFIYDVPSGFNSWCNLYQLNVSLVGEVTSEGTALTGVNVEATIDLNDASQRICPIADEFVQHTYVANNGDSYIYGEYSPAEDGKQNALVIWLHGAGEGQDSTLQNPHKQANDNYIDLLGNEVTALASEEFQNALGGAYVITPQAPTMWMDDGNGNYQYGDPGSCYADSLMELIKNYVDNNPDVDPNRVIIGGCSNGGYMTVEMILKNPDYFAAAYPICEVYRDELITDEQIQALVDSGMGIWFTYAKTDTTVDPTLSTIPTYNRLKEAGANVYISTWDSVVDLTGRFKDENGNPYEYNGHWSWIYFDNNDNVSDDDSSLKAWAWLGEQAKTEAPAVSENPTTTTPAAPNTGDNSLIVAYGAMMLLAVGGFILVRRKENN